MKFLIVLIPVLCALSVFAAPQKGATSSKDAEILKYESENIGIDGYKFAYETSDGVKRTEEAILKNPGSENEALSVTGTISWVAPDGVTYTITFIADENGFQPQGDHLPKA